MHAFTYTHDTRAHRHADICYPKFPDSVDGLGETPLHLASMHGHTSVVELLVKRGCKPSPLNAHGSSPLHLAASSRIFCGVYVVVHVGQHLHVHVQMLIDQYQTWLCIGLDLPCSQTVHESCLSLSLHAQMDTTRL